MMNYFEIKSALNIKYVDLKFVIKFEENCRVPEYKTSALRGGMGQMLLRQNCIRDENCESCDFENECLVRRMMYAKYEIQPAFASRGDSMGYVLECDDRKEYFRQGECLEFHLLLYGKLIVHFSQFLHAFYMLGQAGLGKNHARYQILRVENEKGNCVVNGTQVCLQKLGIRTIYEYVIERKNALENIGCRNEIVFSSPTTLKYEGDFLRKFDITAIFRSVLRRIYCFDCFEGRELPFLEIDFEMPHIEKQEVTFESIPRFSSTQGTNMNLKGIRGKVSLDYLPEELLLVLLAGEKLHIGKNTSFGFGKYVIK